ncbi:MAG: LysM peptidoglycan-binding domain-containing protein, partial [Tabrizicola sp.]
MTFARKSLVCSTALLLSGVAAQAQEACSTYTVVAGDNLRYIARDAYGDADMYRLIYEANVDKIGEKADIIEIGMTLTLPCDPKQEAAASTTEAQPEPETVT